MTICPAAQFRRLTGLNNHNFRNWRPCAFKFESRSVSRLSFIYNDNVLLSAMIKYLPFSVFFLAVSVNALRPRAAMDNIVSIDNADSFWYDLFTFVAY
jgi:hypothetical protein